MNGSSQSGSLITWAAVGVPPPASPSHTTSSNQPSTMADETSNTSNSQMPKPDDHSDFINSFLSSHEDFSSPLTSTTSVTTTAGEDKSNDVTEYDSFHADFSSFLSEAINDSSQPLSISTQSGDKIKDTRSFDSASSKTSELTNTQTEKNHPNSDQSTAANDDFALPSITAAKQQSQESAPDVFDSLDNEVSSAQDILSVRNTVDALALVAIVDC